MLVGRQHEKHGTGGPARESLSGGEGETKKGVLVYPTRKIITYRSDAFTAPPMFVILQYRADQSLRPIASLLSHGVAGCPTLV
jgi:hypothetical protein